MKKISSLYGVVILLVVAVLLLLLVHAPESGAQAQEGHAVSMDTGWDVCINDTEYKDVALSELMFPLVGKGDTVTLTGTLPEEEMKFPVLEFYSIHAAIRVFVAGEEIYSYGQEYYDTGRVIGYGYQYIDLPRASQGKQIRIEMKISEDNAFSSFVTPRICNAKWVVRDYILVNRIPMVIDLFLIIFGICMAGVTAIFLVKSKEMYPLLCIALFSLGIGLWSFCSYNLMSLFFDDMRIKVFIEYGALYLTPIPMFIYFYKDAMCFPSKLRRGAYKVILALLIIFGVVAVVGQATNLIHFPALLWVSHLLLALMIIYLLCMFGGNLLRHRMENVSLFMGVLLMIGFVIFDLARFNFQKFVKISGGKAYEGVSCIGTLLFIVALLIDFGERIARSMYDAAANEALEKLAYTDSLTGLSNRRSCEILFDELDAADSNYTIVTFDLNNLKEVNDCLGHEEGDAFLREFGSVLKRVFEAHGLVGRTGGDEFLVTIKKSEKVNLDTLLLEMNEKIDVVNKCHPQWNMSVAYGVSSRERDHAKTVREAYEMADERMYQKKREMKQKDNTPFRIEY